MDGKAPAQMSELAVAVIWILVWRPCYNVLPIIPIDKGTYLMFSNLRLLVAVVAASAAFLGGCATDRSVLSIAVPDAEAPINVDRGTVYIQSVMDQRRFEENPSTQDIPSLGFGGAANATAEVKLRAIGRKRNGFGKAIGDMLLPEGQNVEGVIREALEKAFLETGFEVLHDESKIDPKTFVIDVEIRQFWAYMTPGFWALTLSSDITTDLDIGTSTKTPSRGRSETIVVKSSGRYQLGTEGNWSEVISKSVSEYVDKAKAVAGSL